MSHLTSDEGHARETLRRFDRVRARTRFLEIQEHGRRVHTPHFVFTLLGNGTEGQRLGVTVTKRVAPTAVERNRVRRIVRECFRRHRELVPTNCDLVVIARRAAGTLDTDEVLDEFRAASSALAAAAHANRETRRRG